MLILKSPAKINLFLRILCRRPDGYHELASLFQAIDLMDTLQFSLSDSDHLTCTDPEIPTDDSNLILKAAHLFRQKTGLKFGLHVHLIKRIPHQAGLGGGSGNAATTLWALNNLLGYPASEIDLLNWSGDIGSDIPFFLSQGTAYCTGRGELMRPMPAVRQTPIWIVKPRQGTSTPAVYKKLDLAKLSNRDPEKTLCSFYAGSPDYFNDLEGPACEVMPELHAIKEKLAKLDYESVFLAGSGSSFICIGPHEPPHLQDCTAYKVNFINRSGSAWYQ